MNNCYAWRSCQTIGPPRTPSIDRLYSLEKYLTAHTELYENYCSFMQEYLQLGRIEILTDSSESHSYNIPHQFVLKPNSSITKLLVVFKTSARLLI